jgi:hypothetical protein
VARDGGFLLLSVVASWRDMNHFPTAGGEARGLEADEFWRCIEINQWLADRRGPSGQIPPQRRHAATSTPAARRIKSRPAPRAALSRVLGQECPQGLRQALYVVVMPRLAQENVGQRARLRQEGGRPAMRQRANAECFASALAEAAGGCSRPRSISPISSSGWHL